ncbi:hypothetical protein BD414DRAFT_483545 [Trametes punicea]|nr:hypothetical protein BD414DRAFT_483545 [Trametes punicea]
MVSQQRRLRICLSYRICVTCNQIREFSTQSTLTSDSAPSHLTIGQGKQTARDLKRPAPAPIVGSRASQHRTLPQNFVVHPITTQRTSPRCSSPSEPTAEDSRRPSSVHEHRSSQVRRRIGTKPCAADEMPR